jgi:transcriptional regulator with GAF, ATPase, and Fis domain
VNHFVKKYSAKAGKKIKRIPKKVMRSLQAYYWPGNVRELENIIERAVVLTDSSILKLDKLFDHTLNSKKLGKYLTLKENEQSLIISALKDSNWVIEGENGAAARLDIAPSTLRDRMKKYGLKKRFSP